MIYTTLNRIREHSPCAEGWKKLLAHLGKTQADDEPLSFVTILDSNGLDDALWCCRAEPEQSSLWRHFAVDCAESVRHLMKDQRSIDALDVARLHASGQATDEELAAARDAAWDAARDARSSAACWAACWAAARDAAWAAAGAALEQRFRYLITVGVWSPVGAAQQKGDA